MICDKCNGKGYIGYHNKKDKSYDTVTCTKCYGQKELDWLENIF